MGNKQTELREVKVQRNGIGAVLGAMRADMALALGHPNFMKRLRSKSFFELLMLA
jgi:hypothetical protein